MTSFHYYKPLLLQQCVILTNIVNITKHFLQCLLIGLNYIVQMKAPHVNNHGLIADYTDGQFSKAREYPSALKINLYYDDVEICNPLGSK